MAINVLNDFKNKCYTKQYKLNYKMKLKLFVSKLHLKLNINYVFFANIILYKKEI